MAVHQEPPQATYNLGELHDEKLNSVEKIESMCENMCNLDELTISDSIKHALKFKQSKQIWALKYENKMEIVTRDEYDARMMDV